MNDAQNQNTEPTLEEFPSDGGMEELESADFAGVAPPPLPVPVMMTAAAPPAHKQLYQFLWGGIAVFYGCLLPHHSQALGWVPELFNPELRGPIGLMTYGGSVVGFAAILFIGAQLYCIKYRKVMLGPIALMALVCAWSWFKFLPGFDSRNLGMPAGTDPGKWTSLPAHALFHNGAYASDFWNHVGPGILFVLVGSTYVFLVFVGAIFGVGAPKKAKDAAPDAGAASRSARNRGRKH